VPKNPDHLNLLGYDHLSNVWQAQKNESDLTLDLSEFEKKDIDEIERVKKMLEASEVIKVVARQSRIMPGGSIVTPNIILATNKRIIKRDSTALGLRSHVDSIPYSQINKVHLEKGVFTSEIEMNIGQYEADDNKQVIQAIPKKKAEDIVSTINEFIRGAQDTSNLQSTTIKKDDEDPLVLLKKRLAKGEISAEEYVELKKVLEE